MSPKDSMEKHTSSYFGLKQVMVFLISYWLPFICLSPCQNTPYISQWLQIQKIPKIKINHKNQKLPAQTRDLDFDAIQTREEINPFVFHGILWSFLVLCISVSLLVYQMMSQESPSSTVIWLQDTRITENRFGAALCFPKKV